MLIANDTLSLSLLTTDEVKYEKNVQHRTKLHSRYRGWIIHLHDQKVHSFQIASALFSGYRMCAHACCI